MNVRQLMGVLYSFSIKNILFDKIDLRFFYFFLTKYYPAGKWPLRFNDHWVECVQS